MIDTYWNRKGKFETIVQKLDALIPDQGPVNNPRKNRKLEKFRKASNCYYDLYNNGLYNRAEEFRTVFGIPSSRYRPAFDTDRFDAALYHETEEKMNEIILAAAEEQNIV